MTVLPTTDLSEDTIPPSPRHPSHAHFPDELGDLERRIEPQSGFQDATLGPNEKCCAQHPGIGHVINGSTACSST